jgi:hypothetical protein
VSAARARYLARRQELLELEAEMQRTALAATLARWEQRRALGWAAGAGRTLFHILANRRIGWLVLAAVLRGLKSKQSKS